jgi:hypothetical protein
LKPFDKPEKEAESTEKSSWADAVKDLTSAGLATIFMTEESVRNYLKDKKLPKEIAGLFLEELGKRKEDLYKVVGKEVGSFLSKMDLSKELARFFEKNQVHFEAKVRFEPKSKEEAK